MCVFVLLLTIVPSTSLTDSTTELIYEWDFDELIRIDIETDSDVDGWFLPTFGGPALSVSTN